MSCIGQLGNINLFFYNYILFKIIYSYRFTNLVYWRGGGVRRRTESAFIDFSVSVHLIERVTVQSICYGTVFYEQNHRSSLILVPIRALLINFDAVTIT